MKSGELQQGPWPPGRPMRRRPDDPSPPRHTQRAPAQSGSPAAVAALSGGLRALRAPGLPQDVSAKVILSDPARASVRAASPAVLRRHLAAPSCGGAAKPQGPRELKAVSC
ncbi:unnamed protein product [Prorocentrum cordatum]|uniref:Subtilisin n=1 Tax=Prorocentrum cordatum TaxID=2364126 RepID=A0ABN9VW29_9DINO|nr:unnamed protein product [Polarella glacialis]